LVEPEQCSGQVSAEVVVEAARVAFVGRHRAPVGGELRASGGEVVVDAVSELPLLAWQLPP
jgi:hypothetical protein